MEYTKINWRNGEVALSDTNLNHMDQGIFEAHELINGLTSAVNALSLALHPVGDIIFNTSGINPSTYIGGTWVQWGKGRVPVGVDTEDTNFDTVEEEGGSADAIVPTHSHTFTGNALGTHNHTQNAHSHNLSNGRVYVVAKVDGTQTYVSSEATGALSGTVYKIPRVGYTGGSFSSVTNTNGATATNNAASAGTPSGTISTVGEAVEGKNLQPYITCYMWKRTA